MHDLIDLLASDDLLPFERKDLAYHINTTLRYAPAALPAWLISAMCMCSFGLGVAL